MRVNGYIFLMICMVACLPEPLLVDDVPKMATRIVVSSQMIPEQGLAIVITRSLGALEAGEDSDPEEMLEAIVIDSALVTVSYGEEVDTLLNYGYGVYASPQLIWQENVEYRLQVKAKNLPEITATTTMTERVTFEHADLTFVPTESDTIVQVNYSFNDPPGRNFYVISVQKYSTTQQPSDFLDPRIFNLLLEDREFDGEFHADDFKAVFPRFQPKDTVAVFLSSINESYYNFLKLQKDSQFSLVEFISEPINYPTNVDGGYGFFNLHTPDVRIFIPEE